MTNALRKLINQFKHSNKNIYKLTYHGPIKLHDIFKYQNNLIWLHSIEFMKYLRTLIKEDNNMLYMIDYINYNITNGRTSYSVYDYLKFNVFS